jgi:hypothetical protein
MNWVLVRVPPLWLCTVKERFQEPAIERPGCRKLPWTLDSHTIPPNVCLPPALVPVTTMLHPITIQEIMIMQSAFSRNLDPSFDLNWMLL